MTKVEMHRDLARPLDDDDVDAIARLHGVYGVLRVKLDRDARGKVWVEYDASRLTERDVESALVHAGIPVVRASAS